MELTLSLRHNRSVAQRRRNDTDEVIFIDNDTDNEEEQSMLIHLYLNNLYVNFWLKNSG